MATYRIEPAFDSVDVALERFDEEATLFAGDPDVGAPAAASTDERRSEQRA